jgi:hypothetical protein
VVISGIWEINYFKGNKVLATMLNKWSVSAIGRMHSGTPYTVTTGQDTNVDGNNNDRADLEGIPNLDPNRSRSDVTNAWFNTAAFVFRVFQPMERMKLEFRVNLVNLNAPTSNINSADFGTIRTAASMRQTQLGLRLFW